MKCKRTANKKRRNTEMQQRRELQDCIETWNGYFNIKFHWHLPEFSGIIRCDRYATMNGNADWRKKGAYKNRRIREAPSAYRSTKSISLDRRPGHWHDSLGRGLTHSRCSWYADTGTARGVRVIPFRFRVFLIMTCETFRSANRSGSDARCVTGLDELQQVNMYTPCPWQVDTCA